MNTEQFSLDMFTASKLRNASLDGEHEAFKACLENNHVDEMWVISSLRYILRLVINNDRPLLDTTPTLKILLKYYKELFIFIYLLLSSKFFYDWTPYHLICGKVGKKPAFIRIVQAAGFYRL